MENKQLTAHQILLDQKGGINLKISDYIVPDGYVWKAILKAMETYKDYHIDLLQYDEDCKKEPDPITTELERSIIPEHSNRRCLYKSWIPTIHANGNRVPNTGCYSNYINEGLFHQWGLSYDEFDNGIGNSTVGIIELLDGTMLQIPVINIKFLTN